LSAFAFLKDALDVAQGAYVQADDPDTGPAKRLWLDTTNDNAALKKRNDADDGWDLLGFIFNPEAKRTIAAAAALTNDDLFVFIDVSGGGFEIDLMDVSTRQLPVWIKVLNGSTGNVVTFDPNGAQTINSDAAMELAEGDSVLLFPQSNTNWETL
jgi:hypothetical protein